MDGTSDALYPARSEGGRDGGKETDERMKLREGK